MKQTYSLEIAHAWLTIWQPTRLPTIPDTLALVKETLFMQHNFPLFTFTTNLQIPLDEAS